VHSLSVNSKKLLDLHWQGALSEYVTAVAWSPDGQTLAASSAAGEVVLWTADLLTKLQESIDQSVDCLAFSRDGQFLAAGGQDGQVKIWRTDPKQSQLIATLENAPAWVDKLSWSPTSNQLAFCLGHHVQVWDADAGEVAATLNFEASSVLGMSWRPDGQHLAVCGDQGAKVWQALTWDDHPDVLNLPTASIAIAWSPDGKYLASGNLDSTLTVWEWGFFDPWVMRGFPGKVRSLAWSEPVTPVGASVLATACVEAVVVWEMHSDASVGWDGRLLETHDGVVQAIAFQPSTFLLASAADDGRVCLWQKAKQVRQILEGAPEGFSCLAWHPQGHQLAAGGQNGDLLIWSKTSRGQGFGRR
jgi:WD40 repeat protein